MSDLLRPCDCDSGFCNHLPNPFCGHICRQDTIEMAEELSKALRRIAELEAERDELEKLNKRMAQFLYQHGVTSFEVREQADE